MILSKTLLFYTTLTYVAGFSGDATEYATEGNVAGGACGFRAGLTGKSKQLNVAINAPMWDGGLACGRCVKINGPKATVVAIVADKCPECKEGDLDMSGVLWNAVFSVGFGREKMSWEWTTCPTDYASGTIRFRIDDGASQNYFAVAPYDYAKGVKGIDVKSSGGSYTPMTHDTSYGIRFVYTGPLQTPCQLRVTYIDGTTDETAPFDKITPGTFISGSGSSSSGTSPSPTTESPVTPNPTTESPVTPNPTTETPLTRVPKPDPTTQSPVTNDPTTSSPDPSTNSPDPSTNSPNPNPNPTQEPASTSAPSDDLPSKWWADYQTCKIWFSGSLCQKLSQNLPPKFSPPAPSGSWHKDTQKCRKYFSWGFCNHLIQTVQEPLTSCDDPYATQPNTWWADTTFCNTYLSPSACKIIGCQISIFYIYFHKVNVLT